MRKGVVVYFANDVELWSKNVVELFGPGTFTNLGYNILLTFGHSMIMLSANANKYTTDQA